MENTQEENCLIAEFMGFTPYGNGKWWNVPKGEDLKYKAFKLDVQKLEYQTSWDWLMPVVEKITYEIVGIRHDLKNEVDIEYFQNIGEKWKSINNALVSPIINYPDEKPIQKVYKAVVEFIKWYNTQKS